MYNVPFSLVSSCHQRHLHAHPTSPVLASLCVWMPSVDACIPCTIMHSFYIKPSTQSYLLFYSDVGSVRGLQV